MARHIGADLIPAPLYRAIVLRTYPGVHDLESKIYTKADGEQILYHTYDSYGIYDTEGKAKAQITSALRMHGYWVNNGAYLRKPYYYGPGTVIPTVTTFIEEVTPQWSMIETTLKVTE